MLRNTPLGLQAQQPYLAVTSSMQSACALVAQHWKSHTLHQAWDCKPNTRLLAVTSKRFDMHALVAQSQVCLPAC